MKTSARFLATLIAVLMIVGAAVTATASFTDVEDGYEHATAVATLSQLGVIGGYKDGTFKPNDPVQRDEMAKLVYVLYTTFTDAGAGSVKFDDVKTDNWAVGYISWCSAMSIVGGYGDGTFKPDNTVTYDEALKMVCATLGYTDFDSSLWPVDVRQKALKELKLGAGLEKVNGSDKLTRGQVAQILYNALDVDMNETKIEYVYDTSYKDADGNDVKVKVPVEVAKTLAEDVWAFEKVTVRVVATETKTFNNLATATGTEDTIKAVVVKADGSLDTTVTTYDLADLGLEAYEENTDALIALDIMTIEKDEELLAKATVLGSISVADVAITGSDEAGVPYTDEVKINGVVYDDAKKSDTLFANIAVLDTTANNVTVSGDFAVALAASDVAELEYPHTALALDHEGDGIVDAIEIAYYQPVKVVDSAKAKQDGVEYTKYYVQKNLAADSTTGAATINSFDLAEGAALAEGDIAVIAELNGTTYVDAVIEPINAKASKLTFGKGATITLGEETITYIDGASYFLDGDASTELTFVAEDLFAADAEAQDYYVYNNVVIYSSAVETVAESYDLALLLYVDKPAEGKFVNNKWVQNFPAVLIIDGAQVTVNLNATKAIDNDTAETVSADGSAYRIGKETDGETAKMAYVLVSYTIDKEDGTYSLKTVNTDFGDTIVVDGASIKINPNTGLYIIDGKKVVMDDASVIYYTYKNESNSDDKYTYLGTYTAANMPAEFQKKDLEQSAYLLANEDGTYTLLAAIVDEKFEAPVTEATRTYENDARLIKYVAEGSQASSVDGVGYYSYLFLDMTTMKNGVQTVDTTLSIADGATKAVAGQFYGWDATAKKYVKVTSANSDAVTAATITAVDTARGIVDLDGFVYTYAVEGGTKTVDYSTGVKLAADVKIFGTAGSNAYTYKVFDIESLAALVEEAAEADDDAVAPIDCAVGTYFDEDGNLCIAWIIVDNYYDVTAGDGSITRTQTSDIVASIIG